MAEADGYFYTFLTQLFLVPCEVTLAISATRLYRALANFSDPVTSWDISSIRPLIRAHHGLRVIIVAHTKNRPANERFA
jgi:hypothetical protein